MIPTGRHGEHLAELVKCRREREAAQAAVERVRALHTELNTTCAHCSHRGLLREGWHIDWPCPTIRALDAQSETTDERGE